MLSGVSPVRRPLPRRTCLCSCSRAVKFPSVMRCSPRGRPLETDSPPRPPSTAAAPPREPLPPGKWANLPFAESACAQPHGLLLAPPAALDAPAQTAPAAGPAHSPAVGAQLDFPVQSLHQSNFRPRRVRGFHRAPSGVTDVFENNVETSSFPVERAALPVRAAPRASGKPSGRERPRSPFAHASAVKIGPIL